MEMQLRPTPAFDDSAKTVVYSINIAQGPQYRMGGLEITGFSQDVVAKLQKAWRCKTGDVYDGNYLEEFLRTEFRKVINDSRTRIQKIDTGSKLNKEATTVDVSVRAS
jgi:outer membrane protein assembly factor BamA